MTILVTPEEKAAITARASALNITAGELLRRSFESYDPDRDDAALDVLATELSQAVNDTRARLSEALQELKATRSAFAERRRGQEPP